MKDEKVWDYSQCQIGHPCNNCTEECAFFMKVYVDKMPTDLNECPYAKWKPYPPIIERIGDWYCTINNRICNLTATECYGYKVLPTTVLNGQDEKEKNYE